MKRTKKQFTVDRIVPDSEGKLHIKVGIHLLLSLCLCLGSLSVLHAEGNEYPSISAMVYLLMIATLVCCVLAQRKSEKQWMKVFSIPYSLEISQSLNKWSKELCTPPLLVSPIKWIFLPFSFAYEKAETISLFFRMLPSAQARLIFTKSW